MRAVPCRSGNRNGLDSLQRGSSAHGRNGCDPAVDQEALLCHLFEQQELAVTCIYKDAVQVPELPLDRGEHRVEVSEIADVRANGETSGSQHLLSRLQRPLIQAADGDARALSVEFLRRGQPDPAVAAGDKDILVR